MSSLPTFREAIRFWAKLGFISFGGPAGQIAIMHTELVAALIGYAGGTILPAQFPATVGHATRAVGSVLDDASASPAHTRPPLRWSIKVIVVSLLLGGRLSSSPASGRGRSGTPAREGMCFSQAAMVTFGGAYAVLPFVGQRAVEAG